jgi:hypothetical protein
MDCLRNHESRHTQSVNPFINTGGMGEKKHHKLVRQGVDLVLILSKSQEAARFNSGSCCEDLTPYP